MTLIPKSKIRDVHGISDKQKQSIIDFLQGAVYCWCKNRPEEWFSMRDLMGGDNSHWQRTPLLVLYEKHEDKKNKEWQEVAAANAGKDSGWLLKRVIEDDKREFYTKKEELIRKYLWKRNVK